jgi:DNA-binding LacI/PurR family transcriptional regulator
MKPFHPLSAVDQLVAYLREEINVGTLSQTLPGVHKLGKELGVSPKTVVAAVAKLKHEGFLKDQGARKKSLIVKPAGKKVSSLRVAILLYDLNDRSLPFTIELRHQLEAAGHITNFALQTITDIGRNDKKIATCVEKTQADVWIILSGSYEVLHWFASQKIPAFACFGRRQEVDIAGAGVDRQTSIRKATRRLIELGHRKIVMIAREERRKPKPGAGEQAFLNELASHDIKVGTYNLPDWEETPEGFKRSLDGLFKITPPTAIILDEASFFMITQQHLARLGILAPQHISLICSDPNPTFSWFLPKVAHINWDPKPIIRRAVRWVTEVQNGKIDKQQYSTKSEFIEEGTIGPAPKI